VALRFPVTMERGMESRTPSIIDLNAEVAKLIMCRRTPQSTMADRKGSIARLATYRDDDGPPRSFVLRAGMMAVIPQGM
jgi:hypothetical protein